MMQDAAKAAGLEVAAVFAIAMYCVQGFRRISYHGRLPSERRKKALKDLPGKVVLTEQDRERDGQRRHDSNSRRQ